MYRLLWMILAEPLGHSYFGRKAEQFLPFLVFSIWLELYYHAQVKAICTGNRHEFVNHDCQESLAQ